MGMSSIELAVHGTGALSADERAVHAILTVTAASSRLAPATPAAAEVLLLDCSSTMLFPRSKAILAREAAIAAVESLSDGVVFAVVGGTSEATMIYPELPELAVASGATRDAAIERIDQMQMRGGTAIGAWLALARDLFATRPEMVGHALLLTDGRDETEALAQLEQVLTSCEGRFGCDALGIGEDYEPTQLRWIVRVLRGRADAVVDESGLAEHFRAIVGTATAEPYPEQTMRIGTMPHTRLRFVRQVEPDHYDLTDRCRPAESGQVDLGTGPLAAPMTREYHVCIDVAPDTQIVFDQDEQVGWVELVGADAARQPIMARWDRALPPQTVLPPAQVRRSDQRAELIDAMRRGRIAYEAQDAASAERDWGKAVALAHALEDSVMLARLGELVEIQDAAAGTVRLRDDLGRSAVLAALVGSAITHRAVPPRPVLGGDPVTCPACSWKSPGGSRFCEACRAEL